MRASARHRYYNVLGPFRGVKNYWEFVKNCARGTFSQHGEDRMLLATHAQPGFYVDVGASDPHRLSNTYLLYRHGWQGITVEPIRRLARAHARWRPRDLQINAGVGSESSNATFFELFPHVLSTFDEEIARMYLDTGQAVFVDRYDVPILPLADIVSGRTPARVELLSIDVEGRELDVLRGVEWSVFKPDRIIIEMVTATGENRQSIELRSFLSAQGYGLEARIGANELYVRA